MNLPELCIRRPVMTTLLMATLILLGIAGYRTLAVSALPRVDFPTIQVSAQLPGASPETMAASVAAPLERQFSTIAGIDTMTSTSSLGLTNIILQFDLDRNIDGAALDVQSAISTALRRLPVEMTVPPSFRKVNPADVPILFVALSSPTLPLSQVDEYAQTTLAQQISQITGVAQVLVFGAQKYAVRVELDPVEAAARGVTSADVQAAIQSAANNTPVGAMNGDNRTLTLDAPTQPTRAAGYRPLVVAWRNGQPIRLEQIARVRDGVENELVASWYNTSRGIILGIQRQPDANTVAVVDKVRALIPTLTAQIPPSVTINIVNDRSRSVRAAVRDVQETLLIAVALVVLVIFVFLKNARATIIPSLALPVSIIGTFAAMAALGYSIDNMSLLALTLSVGFVVDDAIVMLENIVRHVEEGMKPFEAALKGAREIGFTIMSMTISLVAVFIPVLFMGGVVGRVFREFAVTISVTILVSGFVSLTLTPMLCARFLSPIDHHRKPGWFARFSDAFVGGMTTFYRATLDIVLRHRLATLVFTLASIALAVHLYIIIPKGFFPTEDTGFMVASTEAAPDIGLAAMIEHQSKVADIIRADPAVAYIMSNVGATGFSATLNNGRIFTALIPKAERKETMQQVALRLRAKTAAIPGINVFFVPIQNIQIGGRGSKSEYQYTLQSSDLNALITAVPDLISRLSTLKELRDVTSDLQITNPQLRVDVDKDRASAIGVQSDQIRNALYNAFGSRQVGTIYSPINDYPVILQAASSFNNDPNSLSQIFLKSSSGASVPLSAVTRISRSAGPLTVNHQAQQPSATISFNLSPGFALSDAVTAINRTAREANLPLSISTGFSGTAQAFQAGLSNQPILLLAAVLTIYIVLGVLYESFIHPITILAGLPSAGIGALVSLMLMKMDLSVIAIIGIVMLIGIVKKNAIMIVDFALERRRQGADPVSAIREACLLRFRPIMMTTFAAIFGAMPIALGSGAGSELRAPLGIAVVGGLCVSQLLTLYITPIIYLYLERLSGQGSSEPAHADGVLTTSAHPAE